MKRFRKLIPAMCLLLISAMLMGTSTYAWFSMSTSVTATGMQVKATAQDGLLISNADKTNWTSSANAKVASSVLVPTSTAGTTSPVWAHNTSTNADDAQANQASSSYQDLTLSWTNTSSGEGFVDINSNGSKDTGEKVYVLLNEFYIKSSGNTLTLGSGNTYADLYINDVVATSSSSFLKIDNSLRVLIVIGSTAYVYAPVIDQASGTTTLTYNFKQNTAVSALDATASAGFDKTTGTTSIANTDSNALLAKIYIYFQGEDANCKSTNISGITTDDISITVRFGLLPTHS